MLIHAYPTEHLSRKQLLSFMVHLEIIMKNKSPLDYDRLISYSEKSHIALLKKCREFIVETVKLCEVLLECASTTLELALWKTGLNQSSQQQQCTTDENAMIREQSHLIGGKMCQVVIPSVISFLWLKDWVSSAAILFNSGLSCFDEHPLCYLVLLLPLLCNINKQTMNHLSIICPMWTLYHLILFILSCSIACPRRWNYWKSSFTSFQYFCIIPITGTPSWRALYPHLILGHFQAGCHNTHLRAQSHICTTTKIFTKFRSKTYQIVSFPWIL